MGINHWLSGYEIGHPKKRAFLSAYEDCGNITESARRAHIVRQLHYEWLRVDAAYVTAWTDVQERYAERLEREADRRAVEGIDHPVIYQGAITGTYKEYSDLLLIFRLKALKPDMYRERTSTELTGKHGGPVVIRSARDLTDDDLAAIAREGSRGAAQPPQGES